MKNAIVVLNYNDYKTTIDFINQIKDYNVLDLIVVVDNASTDKSYDKLIKYESDKIKIVRCDENKGYNGGNNVGCKYVISKYKHCNIIISNPDIIVSEDTIKEMVRVSKNKDIAIVSTYIMEDNYLNRGYKLPSPCIDSLLNLPFTYRICKRKIGNNNIRFYPESHYNSDISIVDAVLGCFFLIKSDIITNIDYFDENVFLYAEEDILAKIIKNMNKKVVVLNNYVVIHNHSISINKSFNEVKKVKLSNKSKIYFHKKYNNANLLEIIILYITCKIKLLNTRIKCIGR